MTTVALQAPTVTTRTMKPAYCITLRYDAPPVVTHRSLMPVPLARLHENAVNLHAACVEEFGADSPEAQERRAMAEALGRLVTLVDTQAAAETAQAGRGVE